jgi:hypothetical protein
VGWIVIKAVAQECEVTKTKSSLSIPVASESDAATSWWVLGLSSVALHASQLRVTSCNESFCLCL